METIEHFRAHGVRFELQAGDTIRAIGRLDDPLRADIKLHKANIIHELQWREFESLLAIVGPAYRTPAHEYPLMRQAAQQEMPAALIAYREMARQIDLVTSNTLWPMP